MIFTNFVLWLCLVGALAVLADRNITVDDFNPRIVYSGEWKHENSGATFDRFSRTTSYTFQAAASASFRFNGTAVYLISYGVPPPEKDTYQVTLDGKNELHSLRVGVNDTRALFMGYSRTGLDASKEHSITITNLEDTITNVDAFIITVPDVSTVTEAPTTTEQPGRSSGITTNVTLGIVTAFVGISVGLLGALGIYLWRRRKNRDGTSNMEEGGASLVQSAGVPDASLSARVSPFEWAASGNPTQHEGVRKEPRPNGATNGAPQEQNEGSPPPYAG